MLELSQHFAKACCVVLKERRLRLGLSQEGLAIRSGLARSYICDIERGARSPGLFNLSLLAAGLDSDTSQILREVELHLASELNFEDPNSSQTTMQRELSAYIQRRIKYGVMICDKLGRFVLVNEAAQEITGLPLLEIEPTEWSDRYGCLRTDRQTKFKTDELPLYRALLGQSVDNAEMFLNNNASPEIFKHIHITARPLKDTYGNLKGAAVIFQELKNNPSAAPVGITSNAHRK